MRRNGCQWFKWMMSVQKLKMSTTRTCWSNSTSCKKKRLLAIIKIAGGIKSIYGYQEEVLIEEYFVSSFLSGLKEEIYLKIVPDKSLD